MYRKVFNSIFNTKIDAVGLSIFRICYSVILFFEIKQLYTFRHIIYDKEPFQYIGEIDVSFIFYFWFVSLFFLFLGLFTRYVTILNYIFGVIIFSSAIKFEYHVFYAYIGLNFLILFIPISRVLSLDSLLRKIKYTTIGKHFVLDRNVLKINYFVPVFVAIGLVYFDSIFHKFSSKMWMDGLGVWLPSSLPMVTWNDTSLLLNQKWLMLFLGYLVLVFESCFLFLFWFKRVRIPFLILGIFFHIGILIAYPIPWFAMTAVVVYLLMVPIRFWLAIGKKIQLEEPLYTFYYDAECPLCNKVVVVIDHFDIFKAVACKTVQGNYQSNLALEQFTEEELLLNIHGVIQSGEVTVGFWAYVQLFKSMRYTYLIGWLISLPLFNLVGQKVYKFVAGNRLTERCNAENCAMTIFNLPTAETQDILIKNFNRLNVTKQFWKFILIFLFCSQLVFIWFTPFVQNNVPKVGYLNKVMNIPYSQLKNFYVRYLGVTHHAVFMFNHHFADYNYIFKIESLKDNGQKQLVPLLNEEGLVTNGYATGAFWVQTTFRVNNSSFNVMQYQKGIIPYLKYFENNSKSKSLRYTFFVKEIKTQEEWEFDFLRKQIAKPWVEVGTATFEGNVVNFIWNDKMEAILEREKKE